VKSLVYNKTTKCVVAEATAFGHHLLREWLSPFEADTRVKLTAKVYDVTPTHAWQAIRKPWAFSADGMETILKIENTTDAETQSEKIREHDDGTFISVKWEPFIYNNGFDSESKVILQFKSSKDAPKISLEAYSRFNSEYPNIYALGQSSQNSGKIVLAIVQIHPISSNEEIVIDGRICNTFSDHENFRFRPMMSHLGARLENGSLVYLMTIPGDFFPRENSIPVDPFTENPQVAEVLPKLTMNPLGISSNNHQLTDPTQYFANRGMPIRPEHDWMAYSPKTSTLYYQLPDNARELLEVIVNNSTGCTFPQPTHDVAFLDTDKLNSIEPDVSTTPEGLYNLYSVPQVPGMPWKIMSTPYDSEKHPSFVMVDSISHFNDSWSVTTELEIEQHTQQAFKTRMKFTAAERKLVLSEQDLGTEDEDTTTILYLNRITEKGYLEAEE